MTNRITSLVGLAIVAAVVAILPFVAPNSFYLDLAIRPASTPSWCSASTC